MTRRVEKAKLEALMQPDESKFLHDYRHLHATDDAVAAIIQTVDDFTEPVPAIFFGDEVKET